MIDHPWLKSACYFCYHVATLFMMLCLFSVPFCLWLWYGWFFDRDPVVIYGQGVAKPDVVRHGDTMTIFQPVHKIRECDGEVRRVITGNCGHYVVWAGASSVIKDFDGQLVYPVKIPFELIPGQCQFKVHARFYCNPLDRFLERQVYESPAVKFTVKGLED